MNILVLYSNEKSNKTILPKGTFKTRFISFCFKQHRSDMAVTVSINCS